MTEVTQTTYTCNFFGRFSNFYKFQNFVENLCTAIHHYYSTHVTLISIWSCIPHDEVSGQWCTIHLGPLWLQPTFIKGLTCTLVCLISDPVRLFFWRKKSSQYALIRHSTPIQFRIFWFCLKNEKGSPSCVSIFCDLRTLQEENPVCLFRPV